MFRRKSDATVVEQQAAPKPEGKGRPTPTRKEQEAANKARAKTPRTRREIAQSRSARGAQVREGMRNGDERFLLARDRGPVRRFIRDWVDSRFLLAEIVMPVIVFALVLGFVGNRSLAVFGQILTFVVLAVVVVNWVFVSFGLRRELKRRFPDQQVAGTTYYAVMRSMMLRPLRNPKPKAKVGQKLPETYR